MRILLPDAEETPLQGVLVAGFEAFNGPPGQARHFMTMRFEGEDADVPA